MENGDLCGFDFSVVRNPCLPAGRRYPFSSSKGLIMYENDTFVERPWGRYMKLYQEAGVWVKRVEVNPGGRLSLQKHHQRSEKWIIVKGHGLALVSGIEHDMKPGVILDIPVEQEHRIGNIGQGQLVFIEVATGEYLGEDDIARLQDDYAR